MNFPNLDGVNTFAVDLETYDPNLMDKGCGAFRGDGFIAGIALGTIDRQWYFPIRHPSGNRDREQVLSFIRDLLKRQDATVVGHNLVYDLQWLKSADIEAKGKLVDTMYAEAILDEAKMSYSLEATAQTHLQEGKSDDVIYQYLAETYGGQPTRKAQGGRIHLAPVSIVTPYAKGDVDLPIRIWERQRQLLEQDDLMGIMRMECEIIPILVGMRQRGIRVDVEKAEALVRRLNLMITCSQKTLSQIAGREVNVNSNKDLAALFDKEGIAYGRTEKGAPSFTKDSLAQVEHPLAKEVLSIRKSQKFVSTFLEGYIINSHHNGRVHGEFHPLKSDSGGTVSGRFSSSNPNLQNLPSRDDELAPLVRGCFLPEVGEEWVSMDYSQIEPRVLLHYAKGAVAERMRAAYAQDSKTDFYNLVMDICSVTRKQSKTLTLGMMYGMGKRTLAENLGITLAEVEPLFEGYHDNLPFVKDISDKMSNTAQHLGYIKTLLGRRARFDLWVPKKWVEGIKPLSREQALVSWGMGNIKKFKLHAALNRLIQGSAADIMKKAFLDGYKEGMYNSDTFGMPLATIHDEIAFSVPKGMNNQIEQMKNIMINTVDLKVPLLVDVERGDDWGAVK